MLVIVRLGFGFVHENAQRVSPKACCYLLLSLWFALVPNVLCITHECRSLTMSQVFGTTYLQTLDLSRVWAEAVMRGAESAHLFAVGVNSARLRATTSLMPTTLFHVL